LEKNTTKSVILIAKITTKNLEILEGLCNDILYLSLQLFVESNILMNRYSAKQS